MTELTVDIAAKCFPNGTCAIRGLNFSAEPGEFVAIVGPSGAGKSTLLKIISGLDKDFEGRLSISQKARIGFMFQEPRLMPWLTVEQNLSLIDQSASREELNRALEHVGLKNCADLWPKQLSGGMQRRVALLRAFLTEPQLLLMDEPFQSLDQPAADQLRSQLLTLWQEKTPTILFVTHNLSEALLLADRVLFLTAGPSRVALDFKVEAARPRGLDPASVQVVINQLLHEHPQLLAGLLGSSS